MIRKILTGLLVCICTYGVSQHDHPDSLLTHLGHTRTDREKLDAYLHYSKNRLETDPLGALLYGQKASALAMTLGSDSLLAYANLCQGNAFLHSGSYSRALEFFVDVIHYGMEHQDSTLLAVAHANMGNVYYFQQDHENALKNDLLSFQYFPRHAEDKNTITRKAKLLSNIGSIYDETARYEEAEKFYRQAYDLAMKVNDHEALGNVLNNLGTLYRDKGVDTSALQYYTDALHLRERHGNKFGMARSYFSIGLYHFNHDDYEKAAVLLNQSVRLAKEVGSLQTIQSASEYLYQAEKKRGNLAEALAALQLFTAMKDSLYNEQSTRKIAQLEMQFEFDKKQREAEAARKQKEFYYLLGGSILLCLFLIAVILFLIQKNKVRKAQIKEAHLKIEQTQLRNDIETKDKELATNIMFLLSKNELINNISERLLTIKQAIPQDAQMALQKVILEIQSNLQPELWQEFEFRFQQVYENFYRTLTQRFPDLTPSERRLCAFLKLNMTTKEISAITHQNAKSIDVARTRLRKKLGLTGTDQNLVTFLEQLDREAATAL